MNERLTIQDLTDLLAAKHSMTKKDAEAFVKEFFLLIEEALENDKCIKIKGLGTFKLIEVDSRESVKVNTGERFQIKGHTKVTFSPDTNLKDTINKPFAHFETVVLNDNTVLEDTPMEEGEIEEDETTEDTLVETKEVIDDLIQPAIIEQEPEPTEEEAEQDTEPIIVQELLEANPEPEEVPQVNIAVDTTIHAAERFVEQEVAQSNITIDTTDKPKKDKSLTLFLITVIAVVLLLCGGTILFIYYPDLFSSSSKKETLDMPVVTQPAQPQTQLSDTIAKKDTVAKVVPNIPDSQPQPVAKKEAEISSTPVYSDSATYAITGTKTTHTIKEGESLTRVALKYYGTKALWPYIVKHNVGVINNPDNVPYGTTIKIPELTKK